MTSRTRSIHRLAISLLSLAPALAAGYGGPVVSLSFTSAAALESRLRDVLEELGGSGSVALNRPIVAFGGEGGGTAGPVSIGGGGAFFGERVSRPRMTAEFAGGSGWFELGCPWPDQRFYWLRPYTRLTGGGWLALAHAPGVYDRPDQRRWFVGWNVAVAPGLEAMARLRYRETNYVGLFFRGGYRIPVAAAQWYGHAPSPDFDLSGIELEAGIRFGRLDERIFRF